MTDFSALEASARAKRSSSTPRTLTVLRKLGSSVTVRLTWGSCDKSSRRTKRVVPAGRPARAPVTSKSRGEERISRSVSFAAFSLAFSEAAEPVWAAPTAERGIEISTKKDAVMRRGMEFIVAQVSPAPKPKSAVKERCDNLCFADVFVPDRRMGADVAGQ